MIPKTIPLFPLKKALTGLVFAAVIVAHVSSIAEAAGTLKLGLAGVSAANLAGYVAMDQKLFTQYGLEVDLTELSGMTIVQALALGRLDTTLVGGGQAINAYLKGINVRIISGLVNYIPYQLWVRPEISDVKDLKGKKFAAGPQGTSPDTSTRILLGRLHLDPAKDVTIITVARLPLVAPSLVSGSADAALLSTPYSLEARKAGLRMLLDLAPMRIPFPFTSVVSFQPVLLNKAPLLEGFLKGILHGIKLSFSNPETAKQALARYMRLSDPEVIEETYREVLGVTERVPFVPTEAIDTYVKVSGESATRSPNGVLDMGILRKIESSGFVNKLYSEK